MDTITNLVDGKPVGALSGATYDVIAPATGEAYARAPLSGREDVDQAMNAAARAFESWRDTTPAERQLALLRIADAMERRAGGVGAGGGRETREPPANTGADEGAPRGGPLRGFARGGGPLGGRGG